ncbi:RNase P modulator RnpM [Thermodesulfitimonas sp.]
MGLARHKRVPLRQCVGCREMKPKKELIRIVRTPDGAILVDQTGKKSGRGAYICASPECINAAIKNKRLQRALERDIPTEIIDAIREELMRRCPPKT